MVKKVRRMTERTNNRRPIRESNGGSVMLKNMNTSIFPVVDFGCYWGTLKQALDDVFVYDFIEADNIDPNDEYYDEIIELINDKYDGRDDFFSQVLRYAPSTIQEALDEYGVKMSVIPSSCKWYHTREYNFDDEIVFNTTVDTDWVNAKFREFSLKSDFASFIKKEFSSHSGFISFMPDDVDSYNELLDPDSGDYWKVVSAIVGYIISKDTSIRDDITERLYDDIISNADYVSCSGLGIF